MPLNLLLYLGYTLASVLSLIIIRRWLPGVMEALKSGELSLGFEAGMVGVGAILYAVAFLVWMLLLARSNVATAYPIAIGLTLCFSAVAAWIFLGETLAMTQVLGIALIFVGIALVVTRA